MKKAFKFKLAAVLKVRILKEEQKKMEIGRIQVRINELNQFKLEHNQGIQDSYTAQEESLQKGMSGRELQYHPYLITGQRANIDIINAEIKMLQSELEGKYQELNLLRGEVKLFEEMKEKKRMAHKKEMDKKEFEEIEEQVQNWKQVVG